MANEGKSRRADGPGPNKPAAKPAARAAHNRGGMFNLDPEQQARVLIFGAVALVIAIAAGFLVFGYWYSVIKPRHRTVLQVADQKVSYEAMKRRMTYEFLTNSAYQTQDGIGVLPEAAFQALLNELTKVTQAQPKLGITIDKAEIDKRVRERLGISLDADQRQFADALRGALDKTGLSEADYRGIALAEVADAKIREKFKGEAPATEPQARVALISVDTQDQATQALSRINAGEDFVEVAKSVSKEPDAATTGGVRDYATAETMDGTYRSFAFSAAVGSVSDPLPVNLQAGTDEAATSLYIVKLIDRSDQPLTDLQKTQEASERLPEWLKSTQDELRANGTLKQDFDDKAKADALYSIAPAAGAKLAAQKKKEQEDQQRQQDAQATVIAQLTAQPTADPNATAVPQTPAADATPAATPADQGSTGSPVAPAQPVAPGGDGQ